MAGGSGGMMGGVAPQIQSQIQNQGVQANPYGGAPMPFDFTNTTTQADIMGGNRAGAGMGGMGAVFNSIRQGIPQQMPQQMNPYQQMAQPNLTMPYMPQQMNPYQQMTMAPQQQMPQQTPMAGLQSMFNRMMGGYNAPQRQQQQRMPMPTYQSAARSYRPDMTQAQQALGRTATSQAEARTAAAEKEAKVKDDADFQTFLRDQYIRSKNQSFDGGYGGGGA